MFVRSPSLARSTSQMVRSAAIKSSPSPSGSNMGKAEKNRHLLPDVGTPQQCFQVFPEHCLLLIRQNKQQDHPRQPEFVPALYHHVTEDSRLLRGQLTHLRRRCLVKVPRHPTERVVERPLLEVLPQIARFYRATSPSQPARPALLKSPTKSLSSPPQAIAPSPPRGNSKKHRRLISRP